jgi:hypothetical protein
MPKSVLEKLTAFFRSRDPVYLISLLLMTFIATHPIPQSTAALINIDDRNYFGCANTGCWYAVRDAITWEALAERIGADTAKLRDDNPQVTGDSLKPGQMIRVREGIRSAHSPAHHE